MGEISEAARAIWKTEIERARSMSISERVLEGVSLFEQECEVMRTQILDRNPEWTEEDVAAEQERRLEPQRQSKEAALSLGLTP